MKKTFFITTPIYYTNGIPHIGHSYSSIIADSLARFHRINGYEVKFSTGVDENSQKAVAKAEEEGLDIYEYLDKMAKIHKGVWDGLKIEYTDFTRTTDQKHHEFVRKVLQKSFDNGDIYEGEYEGLYCVGCEGFKKDEDLIVLDGKKVCPDHKTEPKFIKEKNYFFKLSKYEQKLQKFYDENPNFIVPQDRFNEVKSFVSRGLEDFSISRETNKFGIKLPFDEQQVAYVWYDALFSYLTYCQNGQEYFWPANLHVVGKDIIKFHGIYWPCMLMSAGFDLPKQILTTGFFTIDGQKISKSLGNVIDPVKFSAEYSKDLMSLYLLSSFNIGQDGDFDKKQAILMYNSRMANNLGNLLNRVLVLTLKLGDGNLNGKFDEKLEILAKNYTEKFEDFMNKFLLKDAIDETFKFLDFVNKFVDENEPWKLIKDSANNEKTENILYSVSESLRIVALNLYAFFPEKMGELLSRIGLGNYLIELKNGNREELLPKKEIFKVLEKGEPLYTRIDLE